MADRMRREAEGRVGLACADCAHWRAWSRGDERCGVCVRERGRLWTRDGWAGACGWFARRQGEVLGVVEGVRPARSGGGRGVGGGGGVRLFDFG